MSVTFYNAWADDNLSLSAGCRLMQNKKSRDIWRYHKEVFFQVSLGQQKVVILTGFSFLPFFLFSLSTPSAKEITKSTGFIAENYWLLFPVSFSKSQGVNNSSMKEYHTFYQPNKYFSLREYIIIKGWGARGVMATVVGNGHGDTSSNPGRD